MNNGNSGSSGKPSVVAIIGFASSLVALVLSLNTCVYNIVGYVEKPELIFIPPEQITLYAAGPKNKQYLAMVTDFNIFNTSRPEKYGLVTGERLEFTIDGVRHVLRWQEFGKWGDKSFQSREQVHPFSVSGGAVNTQEVSFEPRSKEPSELAPGESSDVNWLDWDPFLQFLNKVSTLRVHCVLELQGGKTVTSDVQLNLHDGVKVDLRDPNVGWAAATCKKL
jgi:hypothetical protein